MATMKTLKFPGSSNVYETVDATARAGVASLQTTVGGLVDDTLSTSGKAADAAATGAALAAANAAASSALTDFAGAFNASTAYTAGQYVTYTDGQFYRFTTNHAAGAWNSAHVVAVTAGGELTDLKSHFEYSNGKKDILLTGASNFSNTTLYKSDGTTTTYGYRFTSEKIDISKYKYLEFLLAQFRSTDNIATIAFFDANNAFLSAIYPTRAVNGVVSGRVDVPDGAKYAVGSWLSLRTEVPYIIGIGESGIMQDEINKIKETSYEYVDLNPSFLTPVIYTNAGIATYFDYRPSSQFLPCDGFDAIEYQLHSFYANASQHYNVISFFDENYNYISGYAYPSTGNLSVSGSISVPSGAKYCRGTWLLTLTDTPYMRGIKYNSSARTDKNTSAIIGRDYSYETEIVNVDMTASTFITAYNNARNAYATMNLCSVASFPVIATNLDWDAIHAEINKAFRSDVWISGITHDEFCKRVNTAFTKRIRRFEDGVLNTGTSRNFSIKPNFPSMYEPSLIIEPETNKLYVYGNLKRVGTYDGMTWEEPEVVRFNENHGYLHGNYTLIDGVYYFTATPGGIGTGDLVLYTSTDGVNFEYKGILFKNGQNFGSDYQADIYGNTALINIDGTYYLYIEIYTVNPDNPQTFLHYWNMHLATCTNIFQQNADGTIGDWTIYANNPVISERDSFPYYQSQGTAGNPDFAKGIDNRPIRVDGKFYMYYHCTYGGDVYIMRAYSYDLKEWTVEGCMLNNRDIPTAGDASSGNADHAIIQYKDRTYLFYTWDINSTNTPYLKYMIDDRPLLEMLRLRP